MTKHPLTLEDLAQINLVGDPQLSPDGSRVLYTVKTTNVEKNKYFTHLWLSDTPLTPSPSPRKGEGSNRQFTFGEVSDNSPRWSPDGD